MFKNNALAQALYCIIIAIPFSVKSMGELTVKDKGYPAKYSSVPFVLKISDGTGETYIPEFLKVESPKRHWSFTQREAHYNANKKSYINFVNAASALYRAHQNKRADEKKPTLIPNTLSFYPQSKTIKVTSKKHTFTIPGVGVAQVQLRTQSKVDTQNSKLFDKVSKLHVSCNNKSLVLDMENVHSLYPYKKTLNYRTNNLASIYDTFIELIRTESLLKRLGIDPRNEQEAPYDFLNRLHGQDLEKMVTYYLLNHDVEL